MEDIFGFLALAVPFVSTFVFFGWLYKEEKRREQLRIQRNEEWKKEIQKFRDICKFQILIGDKTYWEYLRVKDWEVVK